MTSRERVKKAIHWERPDRIPVHENFWTDTISVWKGQGLPEEIEMFPPLNPDEGIGKSIESFFDFDVALMFLDTSPRFEQRIIEHQGDMYIYDDRFGYRAKKSWRKSGTIHYLSTKTESRDAWETLVKPRMKLLPGEPARIDDRNYFEHFDPYPSWAGALRKYRRLHDADRYTLAYNYGPWEATWRHRDFSRVLMDIALDPDWFSEMAKTHADLTIAVLDRMYREGIHPDGYIMVDDLGSSTAPLISPEMYREILKPIYLRIGSWLKEHAVDFWLHTCGNVNMLLDEYIDAGVQVLNPIQVTAGMDVLELGRRYKGKLAFYGSIDAHKLAGPWESLMGDVQSRCRMFRDGGWVAHSDHSIPPDMPLAQFRELLALIRKGGK